MTDFDVLIRLARSPGQQLRMTDLATQTALSTSGITRVVDRLEKRGLVRRESARRTGAGRSPCSPTPAGVIGDIVQRYVGTSTAGSPGC